MTEVLLCIVYKCWMLHIYYTISARQLAKAKAWEADMKRKKLEVLKPVCVGCLWSDLGEVFKRDPDWERLQQYTVQQ